MADIKQARGGSSLQIQYRSTTDLIPYEKNPRKNDKAVKYVAESIKEFGFKVPVVIDSNDIVIAGHTRLKAAKKLKIDEVPCIVADDLTEEQVKAFRLADNKVAEQSEWDFDLLGDELDDIMNIDMADFGFEFEIEEEPEATEDDYEVELPEEPKAKLGDIYQLGRHRLMCGDSTSVDDIAKLLNGEKAVLFLSDPPYGVDVVGDDGKVGADFGVAQKGNYIAVKGDDTIETAQMNYDIVSQITDKQIIFGGNYFTEFLPFSDGWLIWDKRCDSGIKNTFADGEMAWCSFHTPVRIYHQLWNGMIREGEKEKRVHPTQKPIKMLGEILIDFSKENDTVLDCFGGSGSTLIACEQLNRTCYMMEYEPYYIDVIIDRWEQLTDEKAVLLNEKAELSEDFKRMLP